MKRINFMVIFIGLGLGLGFTALIVRFFWIMLFTDIYVFMIYTNLFGEFWFEFIFFNLCLVIIVIAFIFLIKSYGEQYGE